MKRIGIFGGSFNPVHAEHIRLSKEAVKKLNLDMLYVMPVYLAPHKESAGIDAKERFDMLNEAFKGEEKITVSDFEINKKGESYTYITAEHFRKEFPNAEIFWIMGDDMLNDFPRWKYPERIVNALKIAVFGREGYAVDYSEKHKFFKETFNSDFVETGIEGKNFSSTRIRVYNALGLPLTGLTDEKVIKYIEENGLYKGNEYFEYAKKVLPLKRLKHTAEVVIKALSKARELSILSSKIETAAVLHDIAKYQNKEDYPTFVLDKFVPEPVVHAYLGAFIAENELGIKDGEILDAIKYHCSGRENMSKLEKLIYTADMVEDTRSYEGVETLRKYFEMDLEKGFIECLKREMEYLYKKDSPIYIETVNAYKYYVEKEQQMESKEFAEKVCKTLTDHKAEDVVMIFVKDKSSVCDYFVVASGRSMTHTRSLSEEVKTEMDKQGFSPIRTEGAREGRWIVLDYGDVLVHLFNDETRLFYHIEKIWEGEDNVTKF